MLAYLSTARSGHNYSDKKVCLCNFKLLTYSSETGPIQTALQALGKAVKIRHAIGAVKKAWGSGSSWLLLQKGPCLITNVNTCSLVLLTKNLNALYIWSFELISEIWLICLLPVTYLRYKDPLLDQNRHISNNMLK